MYHKWSVCTKGNFILLDTSQTLLSFLKIHHSIFFFFFLKFIMSTQLMVQEAFLFLYIELLYTILFAATIYSFRIEGFSLATI